MLVTANNKPRYNAKVYITYTDRGKVSEAIGYYMFCGANYGFVAAGFCIPDEQIISWKYCEI